MGKQKFKIGDKVVIAPKYKNKYNSITNAGEVITISSTRDRARYLVKFEGKNPIFRLYSYELVFANMHALAEHNKKEYEKQEKELPLTTKCKYCGEKFDEVYCRESKEEPGVCEWCADQRKKMPKIYMRKSITINNLKDFSIFGKDGDWLEVTEWANGEGIDIDIHYASDHTEDIRHFQLNYDDLGIIMNIVNKFGALPTIFTDKEEKIY